MVSLYTWGPLDKFGLAALPIPLFPAPITLHALPSLPFFSEFFHPFVQWLVFGCCLCGTRLPHMSYGAFLMRRNCLQTGETR